jgi:predicted NBD/HSP70 family sugar kinase
VLESRLSGARILAEYAAQGGHARDVPGIFEEAARGESAANQSLGGTASLLALTVRTVVSVIDPEIVVLGGGIGAREELIGLVDAELARTGGGPVDLRRSVLGSRAAAVGALLATSDAPGQCHKTGMYTPTTCGVA